MSGADRADLPKSPPDFRILRGKTNEFMIRIYEATDPSDLLAEAFARLLPQLAGLPGPSRGLFRGACRSCRNG